MLKHGIDRLAARAQLASNPFRQLRAIHPLHAVISKMDQDLRTMPSCCPTGKVITGYLASLDTELLGQIREAIGRDWAGIDREKPQGSEEFQLRGEAKARQGRLRIYKINIGKAQAPSSDQIPARNTPIHQPTPYDGANCPLL